MDGPEDGPDGRDGPAVAGDRPTPDGGTGPTPHADDRRRRILELLQRFADALDALEHDWSQTAELHRSDLAALNHLARAAEPMPMGELGGRLSLSAGAITALVDRLEARGHVVRGTDARDRRRVTVEVSSSASELAGSFFGAMAGRILATLDDFDDDELAAIERFLEVLPPAVAPRLADEADTTGDDGVER